MPPIPGQLLNLHPIFRIMPKIAVIGGSGIKGIFQGETERVRVHTPYGHPSADPEIGVVGGREVVFLPRHGVGHRIPPHMINYRANIWALRELGVERVIAVSAVGSLKEDIRPGDLVVPDQFIDFTKRRTYTFYDGPRVFHISMADPFCPELRDIFVSEAKDMGWRVHDVGTYICIEGPRFSTRAESRMFRQYADIIGMTLVPEVNLARELAMCYVTLATVTDYDVWAEKPVTAEEVMETMAKNTERIMELLKRGIPRIPKERGCGCGRVLEEAEVK